MEGGTQWQLSAFASETQRFATGDNDGHESQRNQIAASRQFEVPLRLTTRRNTDPEWSCSKWGLLLEPIELDAPRHDLQRASS